LATTNLVWVGTTLSSVYLLKLTLLSDFSINCPTYYIASSLSVSGQKVWKEVFNAGSQKHGGTAPFFTTDPDAAGVNTTLANIMKDRLLSFAVHNDPNAQAWSGVDALIWPTYGETGEVMETNDTQITIVMDTEYDKSERCKFFSEHGEVVQN